VITRRWQVNGELQEARFPALKPLLHVLREELGLTGPKEGCGEGECGACTVLLNGQPVTSCLVAAGQARDGSTIWTAEGLARLPLGEKIVAAFTRHGAVQCGICFPGMLTTAYALLRDEPRPDERRTREALSGNLCRCTGYSKIVAAILDVARQLGPAGERETTGWKPGLPPGEDPTLGVSPRAASLDRRAAPEAPAAAGIPVPEAASSESAGGGGAASEQTVSEPSAGAGRLSDPWEPAAFHAPRTLDEALDLRARCPGAVLLAGGSDWLVTWQAAAREPLLRGTPDRAGPGAPGESAPASSEPTAPAGKSAGSPPPPQQPVPRPPIVISLADIDALRGITAENGALRIGAGASVEELCADPALAAGAPALAAAARALGARPIRHLATLGGNLVNASPAADLAPPLLAAGARLIIARAGGARTIPLEAFYRGYKKIDLEADEVLTAILLPALAAGEREGFRKLGTRRAQSIAKVCAAVRVAVDAGQITAAAIALGSVAPTPVRLPRTEAELAGQRPSDGLWARVQQWVAEEIEPISDVRSNADYRRAMAGVLVTDLLQALTGSEPKAGA